MKSIFKFSIFVEVLPFYGYLDEWHLLMTALWSSTKTIWLKNLKAFEYLGEKYKKESKRHSSTLIKPISIKDLLSPKYRYRIHKYKITDIFEHTKWWITSLLNLLPDNYDLSFYRDDPLNDFSYRIEVNKADADKNDICGSPPHDEHLNEERFNKTQEIVKFISKDVVFKKLIVRRIDGKLHLFIINHFHNRVFALCNKCLRSIRLSEQENNFYQKQFTILQSKIVNKDCQSIEICYWAIEGFMKHHQNIIIGNPSITKIKLHKKHAEYNAEDYKHLCNLISVLPPKLEYEILNNEYEFLQHIKSKLFKGVAVILRKGFDPLPIKFKNLVLWWKSLDELTVENELMIFNNFIIKSADLVVRITEFNSQIRWMMNYVENNKFFEDSKCSIIVKCERVPEYSLYNYVSTRNEAITHQKYQLGMIHFIYSINRVHDKHKLISKLLELSERISEDIMVKLQFKMKESFVEDDNDLNNWINMFNRKKGFYSNIKEKIRKVIYTLSAFNRFIINIFK